MGGLAGLPHTPWLLELIIKFLQIYSKKVNQTLSYTIIHLELLKYVKYPMPQYCTVKIQNIVKNILQTKIFCFRLLEKTIEDFCFAALTVELLLC